MKEMSKTFKQEVDADGISKKLCSEIYDLKSEEFGIHWKEQIPDYGFSCMNQNETRKRLPLEPVVIKTDNFGLREQIQRCSSELEDQDVDEQHGYSMQSIFYRDQNNGESCSGNGEGKSISYDKSTNNVDNLRKPTRKQAFEKSVSSLKSESSNGSLKPCCNGYRSSEALTNDGDASVLPAITGDSAKRPRGGWEPKKEGDGETAEGDAGVKQKRSRWADDESKLKILGPIQLPNFTISHTEAEAEADPEVRMLKRQLLEIGRKLQSGNSLDLVKGGPWSPSPKPIHDSLGVRLNTREFIILEKLAQTRHKIISKLIEKNPTFKPPADHKPQRVYKKLYIPIREYPAYNFIGLIIGPRGNTLKRMETETGAKIVIRGKGSVREGKCQQHHHMKPDFVENEDLHVLVEADNHDSLDAAVSMLEKLLVPGGVLHKHKQTQLRELSAIKGTFRDADFYKSCIEQGHMQYTCRHKSSTYPTDAVCCMCDNCHHPSTHCPSKVLKQVNRMDDEYHSFHSEFSGGGRGITTVQSDTENHPVAPIAPGAGSLSLVTSCCNSSAMSGIASSPVADCKFSKKIYETKLYVGYLPQAVDDEQLIHLFCPFGKIIEAKVIKDWKTGLSKGYGFIKYAEKEAASCAVMRLNGFRINGRVLAVRIAGKAPPACAPGYGSGVGIKQSASVSISSSNTNSMAHPVIRYSVLPASHGEYFSDIEMGMPQFSGYVDSFSRQRSSTSCYGPCIIPKTYPPHATVPCDVSSKYCGDINSTSDHCSYNPALPSASSDVLLP